MRKLLFVFVYTIVFSACKEKTKAVTPVAKNDTALVEEAELYDTVVREIPDSVGISDTLDPYYYRDSLSSTKPIVAYYSDKKGDAFDKMVAVLIDTLQVVRSPINFSDTFITEYNKKGNPILGRDIYKSTRFTVEIRDNEQDNGSPYEIFLNGRQLRPGIEIDTTLSGDFYLHSFELAKGECELLKFGKREYLLLTGYIHHCNGMGCGLTFYLLYDLKTQKGMMLEQFRSDFVAGYDKQRDCPVFLDMEGMNSFVSQCNCFLLKGNIYRYTQEGQIESIKNKEDKPYYFIAYTKTDEEEFVKVIKANFPFRGK